LTDGTYFQPYATRIPWVTEIPSLEALNVGGEPVLDLSAGVSFDPYQPFVSEGSREGELVVLGNTDESSRLNDPEGALLLLLSSGRELPGGWLRYELPYAGVLRLVSDEDLALGNQPPDAGFRYGAAYPYLLIGESAARELLSQASLELDDLRAQLQAGQKLVVNTGLRGRLRAGLVYTETSASNVVGYIPAEDMTTQGERILVAASYTGPTPRDGRIFPGADENASAVAVMLEVARFWRDIGFQPKRTVVFAALDANGGLQFANHPIFPMSFGDTYTAVMIEGLGAGDVELARIDTGTGLGHLFDQSARRYRVHTEVLEDWRFFFTASYGATDEVFSGLAVVRPGDDLSGTPADTLDHLDPVLLADAGRTIAHYLMVLSNR
jgi:hypothetical protein